MALVLILLGALAGLSANDGLTDAQRAELAQYFGFDTFQIYKIRRGIQSLRLADLDGDGKTDIALWNPGKSRIELFYQPGAPGGPAADAQSELERNEVPNRGNLRNVHLPVAYNVASMQVAELTGDGRPDIVFFGEPKELVILPGLAKGGFGPAESIRAPEGQPRSSAVACGDFNHDGRTDVALLGKRALLIYPQKKGGGLAKPIRLVHNVKNVLLMLPADLNGDDCEDLLLGVDDDEYAAVAFLQEPGGVMGAMRRVKVPKLRSITIAPAPGGDDVFCVESATGRLKQYRWETPPADIGSPDWPQLLYSYPLRSKSKQRPIALGDVTGDGLVDVVAAVPDTAQLVLFAGSRSGLEPGVAYPGLVKTLDLAIADVDGDGKLDVISVSGEEKMVGVSHYENGRLTFPASLPIEGTPQAIAAGTLGADGTDRVLVCLTTQKKHGDREGGTFLTLLKLPGGELARRFRIDKLEDDPAGLRLADVNQDGRNDLLLFVAYSPLVTLLQQADGSFEPFAGPRTRSGLVKEASPTGFALTDVTGDGKPEMILLQKSLARALVVRDGRWTVVDQYNPDNADAQLKGLAIVPGRDGGRALVMYDRKAGELLAFDRRDDGTYATARTMPAGDYALTAMRYLPMADGSPALLVADAEKLALFFPGRVAPTLVEKHSYETSIKRGWLADAEIGDLNHDGVRDIVAVDIRKANLEILTTMPDGELVRVMHFQVFQGKRFSDQPERGGNPREVLVGDVTGDGSDDIVLIAHDRLIVYPSQ